MEEQFNNYAEPPGVFIKDELDARGWSQRDLAYILGYTEQTVNKLISGKQGITADMAKALGDAFGTSAEVWANLQKAYELRVARPADPSIKVRATLQSAFPIREMIRRGWFEDGDQSLLELQVARFFEASSLEMVPKMARFSGAAKKANYDDDPPEQIAWLFRVRQIARMMNVPRYSEAKLRAAISQMRALTVVPEDVRHVPSILKDCGVRFVVSEALPSAMKDKIDGVCTWLDDQSPVIGVSTFYDRNDNFWFVLRHECEHVLRGHGKDRGILDNLTPETMVTDDRVSKEEREANEAALNFCFPREKLESFYARKSPFISERDVIGFAALMETHPAIVVGQIQHIKNDFRWLRKYLVKIRSYLIEGTAYDGWGEVTPASL